TASQQWAQLVGDARCPYASRGHLNAAIGGMDPLIADRRDPRIAGGEPEDPIADKVLREDVNDTRVDGWAAGGSDHDKPFPSAAVTARSRKKTAVLHSERTRRGDRLLRRR